MAWPVLALLAYAGLYFLLLYSPGNLRIDDFGYLQSVSETFARGRPITHDWLEPYTATLSVLGAAAFALSGDFVLSTWGLQAVFTLAAFLLAYRLLREGLNPREASALALVLCTSPPFWFKASEFGGVVLTLVLVLAALLAYRRGSWALFFPAVFLAFATRQNSVALLALPGYHLFLDRDFTRKGKLALLAGFAVFALAALAFHASMNQTEAQRFGLYSSYEPREAAMALRTFLVGIYSALAILSCLSILAGSDPIGNLRANLGRPVPLLIATAAFPAIALAWGLPVISFLTPMIGSLDRTFLLQKALLAAIPLLLWALDWKLVRLDAAACLAFSYVLLSSLKGYWYDFYMVDVALAALFLLISRKRDLRMGRAAWAAAGMLLLAHLAWGYGHRILADKQRLSAGVYERLEREGRLGVADMTDASFGFMGWKLFDHYRRQGHGSEMQNYLCYVSRDRVVVETEVPWRRGFPRGDLPREKVMAEGTARLGFFNLRWRAAALGDTGNRPLCVWKHLPLEAGYRPKPYPLDRREWNEFAEARRRERPAP